MIAGLFWYAVSLVTWESVHRSYDHLRDTLGGKGAVLVEGFTVLGIFFIVIALIRWTIGPKYAQGKRLSKVNIHPENTDADTVSYKNKIRIAIKNETAQSMHVKDSYMDRKWIRFARAAWKTKITTRAIQG
jgi:hypothetical protein